MNGRAWARIFPLSTATHLRCRLAPALLAAAQLLLSSCGGGDSGANASVALSTTQLSQISLTTDVAPSVSLTVTVTNAPSSGVYVFDTATGNGLQLVQAGSQIGSSATINFYLDSPASLGPGTYVDKVQLSFCYDKGCSTQLSGSPQTVTITYTVNLPDPTLAALSSTSIYAGSPSMTLNLYGTQFASQSVGEWNGAARPTTYVSPTQINVQITAADLAVSGTEEVTVTNAAGGGGVSAALPFTIEAESLSTVSPDSAYAGCSGPVITVDGYGYWPTSVVKWNGSNRPTTFVSADRLTAQLTTADMATAGTFPVTLVSGAGEVSNALNFVVMAIGQLSLGTVQPMNVAAGGPAYTMVVTGTGFTTQSTVNWKSAALPTSYVSQTQLLATVPATDIATPGTAQVTVSTGGTTTSSLQVSINAPTKDAVAYQINPAHSGAISFSAVGLPTGKKWTANLGGAPSFAVITSGKVFVTVSVDNNSQVVALDQATGAVDWGPVSLTGVANATYDSGALLVLSAPPVGTAVLQSYDPGTGALSWSSTYPLQSYFTAAPTALNGQVFTSGRGVGGTLFAYSDATGLQNWSANVFYGDASSAAVTGDGVYVAYPCSTYDYQPFTGALVWSSLSACGGTGGATPVVANGVLYAPDGSDTYSGTMFNAKTGAVLGSYVADSPPAFSSSTGFFLQSGTLRAISLSNQATLWSFSGDGSLVTSPIVVNSYVFVGSSSGNIYALDQVTGQILWQDNVGAAIPSGSGWNAGMPMSGLSAGDGLLIVPGLTTLTAYVLSSDP